MFFETGLREILKSVFVLKWNFFRFISSVFPHRFTFQVYWDSWLSRGLWFAEMFFGGVPLLAGFLSSLGEFHYHFSLTPIFHYFSLKNDANWLFSLFFMLLRPHYTSNTGRRKRSITFDAHSVYITTVFLTDLGVKKIFSLTTPKQLHSARMLSAM